MVTTVSPGAATLLVDCDWPGNVRQLEYAILRAAQLARGTSVEVEDLDLPGLSANAPTPPGVSDDDVPFTVLKRRTIEAFERQYLTRLMERCRGNISHAARQAQRERRDLGRC